MLFRSGDIHGNADALEAVIAAIRDRHDGRKRNPFSEPECGHHYARAMSSWAVILALTVVPSIADLTWLA